MTSTWLILILPALFVVTRGFVARAEDDAEAASPAASPGAADMPMLALERVLRAPPATGLVVVAVAPGGAAMTAGVVPGDVIVAYGGRPVGTVDELRAAKASVEAGEDVPETVPVGLVGAEGVARRVELAPGPLGVADLRRVTKGEGAVLPIASGAAPDLAVLGETLEEWMRFEIGGEHVGFEYAILQHRDGEWRTRREVAFDGGERWGRNHMDVEARLGAVPGLHPRYASFENVLNGWRGVGTLTDNEGTALWRVRWHHGAEAPQPTEDYLWRLPPGLPIVPSYFIEYFARAMPLEVGACWLYRPLHEGMGRTALPAWLRVAAKETVTHDGAEVEVWRVEQWDLGGEKPSRHWVDAERRALRVDYRGAIGTYAESREEALEGLGDDLVPRGAVDGD